MLTNQCKSKYQKVCFPSSFRIEMYGPLPLLSAFRIAWIFQVLKYFSITLNKTSSCEFHAVIHFVLWVNKCSFRKKSGGPFNQFLIQGDDCHRKVALCDEVPRYDVERARSRAGRLLLDPAEQSGVRGHHQVLQRLCGVGTDVFQVLSQINARHKETSCNTKHVALFTSEQRRSNPYSERSLKSSLPGLPRCFRCSNSSMRASALHLLAHQ